MTLPAPSDAAIEAARDAMVAHLRTRVGRPVSVSSIADAADVGLTAALPLLHAQWAAEVQAALRDSEAYRDWLAPSNVDWSVELDDVAEYLADTLGAKPEETHRG